MEAMTGDVLDINNIYQSYSDYKRALDGELQRSAESFVRIGYLLKVARDTDILRESGYDSVNDFAQAEYDLDKSQVSRFIRINDEFSENGYSDNLQERYRNFGYAKLSLMLLLPEAVNEELSADYSKAEIQAVKEEIDEEKKISDLEVMMEKKDVRQQDEGVFWKVFYQIGKEEPELYLKIYDAVMETVYDGTSRPVVDKLMDALAPAGERLISTRIPGEGRKMLSIKGADIDPVVVDIRSGEKQSCTWDELIEDIEALCDGENGRKSWEILYGEPFPEKKAEVAPVQPKKKPDSGKAGRVVKAKKPEKTSPDEGQEAAGIENEESREDTAQGAACADSEPDREHPDDPEPADKTSGTAGGAGEDSVGSGEDRESGTGEQAAGVTDPAITDADGMGRHIENQAQHIIGELERMQMDCTQHNWDSLIERARGIIVRAENIKKMEEMWNVEG